MYLKNIMNNVTKKVRQNHEICVIALALTLSLANDYQNGFATTNNILSTLNMAVNEITTDNVLIDNISLGPVIEHYIHPLGLYNIHHENETMPTLKEISIITP